MSLEPLKPGQIRFHQWCKPPLDPGDYKLNVTQTVDELKRRAPFEGELSFSVAGPRFSLNPADIYCVYPPNGEFGDFANSLPHVVFTRRTLPWERNLHPGADPASDKPWMAILSFSMADFADYKFPEIKVRRIKEVLQPETNIVGPQKIQLQSHESDEDLCNTIDIPGVLFRQIAPRLADLGYLAHVREVDTGDKETLSFLADGWFSVVLGNRFPEPEKPTSDGPLAVARGHGKFSSRRQRGPCRQKRAISGAGELEFPLPPRIQLQSVDGKTHDRRLQAALAKGMAE
jgi:hypothetical protein